MRFRHATTPVTFMHLMTIVFSKIIYRTCLAYLDDIFIFGRTFNEHFERLELTLKRLKNANLKLKLWKCLFGQRSVTFPGHIINDKGPRKVKTHTIVAAATKSIRNAKFCFKYATYYRKFIKGFAHIATPLNRLVHKQEAYNWLPDCDAAFKALKTVFSELVTLPHSDFKKTFTVDTDANCYNIGGVLFQKN